MTDGSLRSIQGAWGSVIREEGTPEYASFDMSPSVLPKDVTDPNDIEINFVDVLQPSELPFDIVIAGWPVYDFEIQSGGAEYKTNLIVEGVPMFTDGQFLSGDELSPLILVTRYP